MQIKSLCIRSYRSFRIDDTACAEAVERLGKIETYPELRSEGGSESTALRASDNPGAIQVLEPLPG